MRIGFDATVLDPATRYTGAGQYAEKLLQLLPGLAPDDEFVLYGSPPTDGFAELPANATWHPTPHVPLGRLSALASHLLVLPRLIRDDRLDLLHVPTVHTRPSLSPVPRRQRCPLIVTLHDLIPMTYYGRVDKPLPWRMRMYYRWNLSAAKKAQRIITVSESARTEILANLRLRPDRIVAIHNGVDFSSSNDPPELQDAELPSGDAPYILFGGSFEPRKNLMRLIEAFDLATHQGLSHNLVMIVDSGSGHAEQVVKRARRLSCADRLRFMSGLDGPTLRAVYREATTFAFPTLSEGFGLPPLQAMASGVPVIASDIPVMREVLGEAAYYVDPYSPLDIANALTALGSDDSLRDELADAGRKRAAGFSWEETARRTLDVYRSVVGEASAVVAVGGAP